LRAVDGCDTAYGAAGQTGAALLVKRQETYQKTSFGSISETVFACQSLERDTYTDGEGIGVVNSSGGDPKVIVKA
jgi:hypothetical protein